MAPRSRAHEFIQSTVTARCSSNHPVPGAKYKDVLVIIKTMQKIATRVFIYASVTFGIIGILVVLTASGPDKPDSNLSEIFIRLLFINVFIILPSFALSVAGKYLNGKS
jgi:hypothetical protein